MQNVRKPVRSALSPREAQCLKLLCRRKTTVEIARELGLAEPTIVMHIKRARERLGARTREQAVAIAIAEKLITIGEFRTEE